MEKIGSIEIFNELLLDERGAWLEHRAVPTAADLSQRRKNIRNHLKEVGKSGDVGLILATEKTLLVTDLTLYSNSPAMKGSLTTALSEVKAAEALLPKVDDPALYKSVDEAHSLPKNRSQGVPKDEARQFFRSHDSRLVNADEMDKVKAMAGQFKLSVSEMLRRFALGHTLPDPGTFEGAQAIRDLLNRSGPPGQPFETGPG